MTWARSGREVFFTTTGVGAKLAGVTVEPGNPTPLIGPETELFAISPYLMGMGNQYATAPDGRFLMIKRPTIASRTITVITHWIDELKERVPLIR